MTDGYLFVVANDGNTAIDSLTVEGVGRGGPGPLF